MASSDSPDSRVAVVRAAAVVAAFGLVSVLVGAQYAVRWARTLMPSSARKVGNALLIVVVITWGVIGVVCVQTFDRPAAAIAPMLLALLQVGTNVVVALFIVAVVMLADYEAAL